MHPVRELGPPAELLVVAHARIGPAATRKHKYPALTYLPWLLAKAFRERLVKPPSGFSGRLQAIEGDPPGTDGLDVRGH